MGKKNKTHRNDPCPCGSGKKYKRCHGNQVTIPSLDLNEDGVPKIFDEKFKELEALGIQREKQQGLGRPIVSELFKGYRLIAVGGQLFWSQNWKTFHDFLLHYIKHILGSDWGNAEIKKPFENRHPIMQWYDMLCRYQAQCTKNSIGIYSAPATGAIQAYLTLAYNLYLTAHNARLQELLITRLKKNDQFHAAYYETYVAAAFIKAGFDIEFEDESDSSTTHCEFTAINKVTGNKYSIEAKSRTPNKETTDIVNQLHAALKKNAAFKRVVFIDMNVPLQFERSEEIEWMSGALRSLRNKEGMLTIKGNPAPEAYVFVTNYPYHLHLDTICSSRAILAEGFKISDFKMGVAFPSIRDALNAREKHKDMYQLMASLKNHDEIPSTFDGEIPEFAFDETIPRLKIGNYYTVPVGNGKEERGKLTTATVAVIEKLAYCAYSLDSGKSIIATCPLTDEELAAYNRHPNTFFGTLKHQGKQVKDPIELFDFFYETYSKSSKEKLLEFMKDHPDIEKLKGENQRELALTYCERLVYATIKAP